jgi:hypothetical protein
MAITNGTAQNTNSGDIRGLVTDTTGAVIPGVTVKIVDLEKGVTKELTTNSVGIYDSGSIVTGTYKVSFTKPGFSQFVRSSITLEVGTISINAELKTGAVTEEVVVTADVPLLQTETGELSTTLPSKQMQDLPNKGQDWQNFVKMTPGATGTASYSGATGQALSVNGNLPYNAVLNDGASSALSHSGNADVSVFETVQELQVSTSAFSAQYGVGGAVFNQISKGGSNTWHGSLYEYAQNDFFNARSYFQTAANGVKRTPYVRYHNFGGAVSGPILHDKAFFYFNYDHIINQSASTGFITVPTDDMREGKFTGMAPIYDPATTISMSTGGKQYIYRTQITDNKLKVIDPVAAKIQEYYPHANVPVTPDPLTGVSANNYGYSYRGSYPFQKFFGRFDYMVTPSNRITGSVTKRDNPNIYRSAIGCPINCYTGDIDSYNSQLSDVWNINSSTVNELRFGYTNQLNFFKTQTTGKGTPAELGLLYSHADIFPTINISSYSSLAAGTSAIYKEHNFDPSDVVTMVRGHHALHFGGEYLIFQDNSTAWNNINGSTSGFTGSYTQCTYCVAAGTVQASGNAYADFLMGNIQNWSAGVTPEYAARQKAPQMFVQDDWKMFPSLTVNLGLRYQIMEGWSDNKKNQSTFDPLVMNAATRTLGAMWYAGNADHGRKQLQDNVYNTFLPRIGFAWQVRPNLVVRGGFGYYAYLWSLDTYGNGEGGAFGAKGSLSDTTNGYTVLGSLSGTNPTFNYVPFTTVNSAFNGQSVSYNKQKTPVSKIQQYNLTLDRTIGSNMSVTLGYVGSHSTNLVFTRDINQVPESKLAQVDQQFRPYPQFNSINGSTGNADANYNSLQATFQRRMTQGLSIQTSYVWSKFLDEFDSSAWSNRAGTSQYQNSYDIMADYGPSNYDVRHAFKGNVIYQLPFGNGKPFLNNNWIADEIVGGWQLTSTFVEQTGNPFTPTVSGANNSYAGSGAWYPNKIGQPRLSHRSINKWFNTAAFSVPTAGTFGNNRRNDVYGPGMMTVDLSMGKTFNVYRDIYKFQLRIDATNALNHPVFGLPDSGIGGGGAGKITGTTLNGRNIQLGGRFSF